MPCTHSSSPFAAIRPLARAAVRWRGLWAGVALAVAAAALPSHAGRGDALAQAAQRYGPQARAAVLPLHNLLGALPQLADAERLRLANHFFNSRLAFRADRETWGQDDYWASPLEALDKGAGDCEDFAIAKYLSLVAGGLAAAHLRLVYVRARTGAAGEPPSGQAHMVLAYYAEPQAEPLILDNLTPEILPASRRPDLTPVFSFNAEGLWQGVGANHAGDPLARLTRWRAVLLKARQEGFH